MESKCIRFYEFGEPRDVLKVERKTVQRPANGEILVRMTARPINPSDVIPIRGAYAHRITLPAIPGYEGVGIVEEVGPFVSKELLGQRVLPLRVKGHGRSMSKQRQNSPFRFHICWMTRLLPNYTSIRSPHGLYVTKY